MSDDPCGPPIVSRVMTPWAQMSSAACPQPPAAPRAGKWSLWQGWVMRHVSGRTPADEVRDSIELTMDRRTALELARKILDKLDDDPEAGDIRLYIGGTLEKEIDE